MYVSQMIELTEALEHLLASPELVRKSLAVEHAEAALSTAYKTIYGQDSELEPNR